MLYLIYAIIANISAFRAGGYVKRTPPLFIIYFNLF
jgi:hypothetical protein